MNPHLTHTRWLDTFNAIFDFKGYSEHGMLDSAERGVSTVYWVMVVLALPSSLWQYLFSAYRVEGVLYALLPLVYLPVAMRWFPRQPESRLYVAALLLTVTAVSVNSLNDWRPQPGLYLMIPITLIIFCVHGSRGLLALTGLQLAVVGATSAILGISTGVLTIYDLLISLALWVAVVVACAMLVRQILDSSRFRARELETLTDRLWESEARLRDNTLATQRVVRVSLEGIATEMAGMSSCEDPAVAVRLRRIQQRIDELQQAVIPASVAAEPVSSQSDHAV